MIDTHPPRLVHPPSPPGLSPPANNNDALMIMIIRLRRQHVHMLLFPALGDTQRARRFLLYTCIYLHPLPFFSPSGNVYYTLNDISLGWTCFTQLCIVGPIFLIIILGILALNVNIAIQIISRDSLDLDGDLVHFWQFDFFYRSGMRIA
jgi:hypothetical protein